MEKVLCVCVGNISRSPMMQAVLQSYLGPAFLVESAGVSRELSGRPANHRSIACLKERGIDLSGHVSRWIGDLDLEQYGWIICVGHDEADQVRSNPGHRACERDGRERTSRRHSRPLRIRACRLSRLPGSAGPRDAPGRAAHQGHHRRCGRPLTPSSEIASVGAVARTRVLPAKAPGRVSFVG